MTILTGTPDHGPSGDGNGGAIDWQGPPSHVRLWLTTIPPSQVVRAEPLAAPREPYEEVARVLEGWIAGAVEAKALPALSIALVDDQRIVWARGFGFSDRARRVPATAETVYRVGSVSKLFTDTAVMRLVEEGRLDLDAPDPAPSCPNSRRGIPSTRQSRCGT